MTGRTLAIFISVGGFCALLGFFTALTASREAAALGAVTLLILLVSFFVSGFSAGSYKESERCSHKREWNLDSPVAP
ncbi:hypothetical protein [Dyella subtropica]|uniref:hypothetical protein n=1 Tax=Dyella subtropica TaxID=2992127 RepID=UPI002257466E|nr:hypothetical protein [Dyella subtropica]